MGEGEADRVGEGEGAGPMSDGVGYRRGGAEGVD